MAEKLAIFTGDWGRAYSLRSLRRPTVGHVHVT